MASEGTPATMNYIKKIQTNKQKLANKKAKKKIKKKISKAVPVTCMCQELGPKR
jgi:hypothetical protein